MVNQDSFTPQEYAKIVGMFPDPPSNPLPTGGYMDAGFDWVVHQAEGEEFVGDFNRATMNEDYWLACPNSVYAGGFNKNCKEVIRGGGYGYICENCGEEFHETAELDAFKMAEYQAEAVPISEEEGLFVVRNNMGQTKGFIEMEDDEEEEAVEIEISDDEMEEIAEIKLGAEEGVFYQLEVKYNMEDGWEWFGDYDDEQDALNAYHDIYLKHPEVKLLEVDSEGDSEIIYVQRNFNLGAETATYKPSQEPDMEAPATEPTNANFDAEGSNYSFEPYTDYGGFAHDTDDCRGTLRFEEDSRIGVCEDCGEEVQISEKDYDWIMNEWFGAETFGAERSDDGIVYVDEDNSIRLAKGSKWMKGSGGMEDYYVDGCNSCHEKLDGYKTQYVVSPRERWAYCMECFDQMKGREGVTVEYKDGTKRAESKSMFSKDKNGKMYARRRNGRIITHNAESEDDLYELPATELIDLFYETRNALLPSKPAYDEYEYELLMEQDPSEIVEEILRMKETGKPSTITNYLEAESTTPQERNRKNADFAKPSRDWFSLALGTAAVVIGGSLFLQNRGVFKADGDEMAPVGTGEPSLVAHPTTGDLLPADYEEMVVESTGYAVPVIPVSLDPSFMGSRFHALPTDRVVESNEPGIGAHTDVAINRDTNYREPEQSVVTEPPFAYRFKAEAACECSIFDKIKSFFTGKPCCVEEKEANSVTGQTPYFGVGFDGRNTQERVIKETNPVSLDPSVSPFLPLNLSGYTGQAYAPPSIYSSMMAVGETGQNPAFTSTSSPVGANRAGSRSVDSSALQSVHGTLSANVNQSYTDGSRTMSLSQWSIEYDVSQISDTEAFVVSRASGERSMIRRV